VLGSLGSRLGGGWLKENGGGGEFNYDIFDLSTRKKERKKEGRKEREGGGERERERGREREREREKERKKEK
jgi:hypothetical protein